MANLDRVVNNQSEIRINNQPDIRINNQPDIRVNNQPDIQDDGERISMTNTSVVKVVLLFYLFSMSQYSNNLIGKPLRRFIEDNRIVQHVISFLVLFVLLSLQSDMFSTPSLSIRDILIYTIIGYTWFIFSSKLDAHWNIILLIVLLSGFVLDSYFRAQEVDAKTDPNLTNEQKVQILQRNNIYRMYLAASAILITILGTLLYSNRKSEQYGGSYDIITYLFY